MVNWKDINKIKNSDKTIKEIIEKNESIEEYVENPAHLCSLCKNPKTQIPRGCLLKKRQKEYVQIVLKTIREKNLNNFGTKDIIKALGAENISDGNLQRQALIVLVLTGFLRKTKIEYHNKLGQSVPKYIFKRNTDVEFPSCVEHNKKGQLIHKSTDWEKRYWFGLHKKQDENN